jgi:hypothetical protein
MEKRPVEIGPRDDGRWYVKREGASRASSIHQSKVSAERTARATARRDRVEMVEKGRDGRIQNKDSFGNDPFPPRDMR